MWLWDDDLKMKTGAFITFWMCCVLITVGYGLVSAPAEVLACPSFTNENA